MAELSPPSYPRKSVRAFRMPSGKVAIVAKCPAPPPMLKVKIIQDPSKILPPFYRIVSEQVPIGDPVGSVDELLQPGGDVPTPFRLRPTLTVRGEFEVPASQERVRVDSEDASDDVKVENLPDPFAMVDLDAGGAKVIPARMAEGIGYSDTSIEEAFIEAAQSALTALAKLPPSEIDDEITTVRIVETGALYGGIVGFHHRIIVRVRAS